MSKTAPPDQPTRVAQPRGEGRNAERSAAALRDNLKRRKEQQRARIEPGRDGLAGEQAGRRKP